MPSSAQVSDVAHGPLLFITERDSCWVSFLWENPDNLY